ncbi:alpha/beta-type small acid-soluble spore protein [Caldicellulosiruptor changbaiensis]|uniref:Alpha/beta-type small acid-soluble spore protein n=1 Tax=Caldicellulosiruptor changbaiensis TaxID=1222016 RepID=A0A3T0D5B5_9FIRM|nr:MULTISPECIES: alpha/beta-type small acid-soluble spore protein [Caldicellulosiruptor]AZT90208.1 alpha/beta-type small acid-soluble spore protein [Caldicellulosiruptor changbaiensis]
MPRRKRLVPEAAPQLDKLKQETAQEVGVTLDNYNPNITTKQAGTVGGYMVKKMIQDYQNRAKNQQ